MKRLSVILTFILASVSLFAAKRLVSITQLGSAYSERRGDITYGADGRISKFVVTEGYNTESYEYSYNGNSEILIDYWYDNRQGHDTYKFSISNGKIISEDYNIDGDDVSGRCSYGYTGEHLTSLNVAESCEGMTEYNNFTWSWNGDVLSEMNGTEYGDNVYSRYTYSPDVHNTDMDSPMICAIFGFTNATDMNFYRVDCMFKSIVLYPYIGNLPQKLISYLEDYDGEKTQTYSISYERDADGYVNVVNITTGGSTITYNLGWEVETGISDVSMRKHNFNTYYTLSGQRVSENYIKTYKAPYILNGRVVIGNY